MTSESSIVEQLGFSANDRVVVVHVDDLGMCRAANVGGLDALAGCATSGSVMVPCPAFDEIAAIARERPELDLGVHLTLNSEYEGFRWGPVRADVPSLSAPDGGLWPTTRETVENAEPREVELELRAQIERALEHGIDVTHIDSHMGTVFDLKFVEIYLNLAREFRVPAFIPRVDREVMESRGLAESLAPYFELIARAEGEGFPIFDHFDQNSLHFEAGQGLMHNRARLSGLGPGLSYLITHCAAGDEELQRIAPDWRCRSEEHQLYSDGQMEDVFRDRGIQRVGMRPLRDQLRTRLPRRAS